MIRLLLAVLILSTLIIWVLVYYNKRIKNLEHKMEQTSGITNKNIEHRISNIE